MRFMDKEGKEFEVGNEAELVARLNATSHTPCENDATWMKASAVRILTQMGKKVSTRSPKAFVRDLCRLNLMVQIPSN